MSIAAVRDGLKAVLDEIPELNVFDTLPDQAPVPAGAVRVETVTYDTSFEGDSHEIVLVVLLVVSSASGASGQEKLDSYIDPDSETGVRAMLDANPSLNGAVFQAVASGVRNYGPVNIAGVDYLGAEVVVQAAMG